MKVMRSRSEEQTGKLAARLAKRLKRGGVILLDGDLGAGKTVFVRGFLRGLGHRGAVPSPTFTIVNEYPRVRPRVYHMDLYRVEESDRANLEIGDYFAEEGCAVLVEWPAAARPFVPAERIEVSLKDAGENERTIRLRAFGPRARAALAGLSA